MTDIQKVINRFMVLKRTLLIADAHDVCAFDRLWERAPKEWEFWMMRCCKHDDGTPYGWGEVLDYIGIPWRDPEHWWLNSEIMGQTSIFDFIDEDGNLIEIGGTE